MELVDDTDASLLLNCHLPHMDYIYDPAEWIEKKLIRQLSPQWELIITDLHEPTRYKWLEFSLKHQSSSSTSELEGRVDVSWTGTTARDWIPLPFTFSILQIPEKDTAFNIEGMGEEITHLIENGYTPTMHFTIKRKNPVVQAWTLTIHRMATHLMSSEGSADTQFIAYTRRFYRAVGDTKVMTIDCPKKIYAQSSIISPNSDYIAALLADNGFLESEKKLFSSDLPGPLEQYTYESDSDLDDEVEVGDAIVEEHNNASEHSQSEKLGKVIVIKDFAYKTWRAFLYYLYTGKVSFTSTSSSHNIALSVNPEIIPMASAKSMYRLAHQLGSDGLCEKAFVRIKSQLTVDNIGDELFSKFTSWFPKIRDMELEFLFAHWDEVCELESWDLKMKQVARGELSHAASILIILTKRLVLR